MNGYKHYMPMKNTADEAVSEKIKTRERCVFAQYDY